MLIAVIAKAAASYSACSPIDDLGDQLLLSPTNKAIKHFLGIMFSFQLKYDYRSCTSFTSCWI